MCRGNKSWWFRLSLALPMRPCPTPCGYLVWQLGQITWAAVRARKPAAAGLTKQNGTRLYPRKGQRWNVRSTHMGRKVWPIGLANLATGLCELGSYSGCSTQAEADGPEFGNLTFGQNPFRQILFARRERYFLAESKLS
jgi:hypothetical protein